MLLCQVLKVALWDPQHPHPPRLSKVNTVFSVHLGSVWRKGVRVGERIMPRIGVISWRLWICLLLKEFGEFSKILKAHISILVKAKIKEPKVCSCRGFYLWIGLTWGKKGLGEENFPCSCILKISSISTWSGLHFPSEKKLLEEYTDKGL